MKMHVEENRNIVNTCTVISPPPPPHEAFKTVDECKEYVTTWAKANGFVLTIMRSEKDKRIDFACDKGGPYRNRYALTNETRVRQSCSQNINCPYKVRCYMQKNDIWGFRVVCPQHKHPLEDMLLLEE